LFDFILNLENQDKKICTPYYLFVAAPQIGTSGGIEEKNQAASSNSTGIILTQ